MGSLGQAKKFKLDPFSLLLEGSGVEPHLEEPEAVQMYQKLSIGIWMEK